MRPEHMGNTITSTTHRYGQSTYYKRTNQSSESLVVAAQVQFIQAQGSQILSVYLGFFPFRLAWLMASPCVTHFFSKLLLFSKYLNPWTVFNSAEALNARLMKGLKIFEAGTKRNTPFKMLSVNVQVQSADPVCNLRLQLDRNYISSSMGCKRELSTLAPPAP